MRIRKLSVDSCSFTPRSFLEFDHKVCLKLKNLDDFVFEFAMNYDLNAREYFTPYQILGNLEEEAVNDFIHKHVTENVYTIYYWKRGEGVAFFEFEGYSFDEDSRTLIIEFSYVSTAS